MINLMRVSLRDLVWLILLAACLTAWGMEHRKVAKEITECRRHLWFVRPDRGEKPSGEELKRRVVLAKLSKWSDQELDEHLSELQKENRYERRHEYEPCLTEMARRGLVEQLQRHYDLMM